MSIFSNKFDAAADEADAYIEAVLGLVGDRDPIEILEELPQAVADIVRGMTEHELGVPEAEGKWSGVELLAHLADSELVWGYRLRMVLAEAGPVLTGYDQDRWVKYLKYKDRDFAILLEELGFQRRGNLRLLKSLSSEELDRSGRHSERGSESVRHMVHLYAGHDLVHRKQLHRIRTAVLGEA